jgi:hypothetical protein
LSRNSDPFAADVLVTKPWKLEPPKCSVNAHLVALSSFDVHSADHQAFSVGFPGPRLSIPHVKL